MNKLVYGFNVNLGHIGWTALDLTDEKILGCGIRKYTIPENPKEKNSLAEEHHLIKSRRRNLRRRKTRLKAIKSLIIRKRLLTKEALDELFSSNNAIEDIYTLRAAGLDRLLKNDEWARVLIHLAKHRGYNSTTKAEKLKEEEVLETEDVPSTSNDEIGKMLKALRDNELLMAAGKYRTVGEMINKDSKFKIKKRNSADCYDRSIHRKYIILEAHELFTAQRALGNQYATYEIENKYMQYMEYQKPYATRELIEKMAGKCTLIKGEPRYAKNTYSFERFSLLQKVNTLKINDKFLTQEQRQEVIDLAYQKKKVTFTGIRNVLSLDITDRFNYIIYSHEDIRIDEKAVFFQAKFYHTVKDIVSKVSDAYWNELKYQTDNLDLIGYMITVTCSDTELHDNLMGHIPEEIINIVEKLDFSGFGSISKKAIDKILPYLEKGEQYITACYSAGLDPNGYSINSTITSKLPVLPNEISNTRFKRVISQFRKVYNAMIEKYGVPTEINIIVSKELSMKGADRNKLLRNRKKHIKDRENLRTDFYNEYKVSPTSSELIKYQLWLEQGGIDPYSGEEIPAKNLLDSNYTFDYILNPYFVLNNGLNNMVLADSNYLTDKGLKTTYEILDEDAAAYDAFSNRISEMKLSNLKKAYLLKRKITDTNLQSWRGSKLQDNKINSAYFHNLISSNINVKVNMYNESLVNFIRTDWRLPKKEGTVYCDCIDSMITAVLTNKFIKEFKQDTTDMLHSNNVYMTSIKMPYSHFKTEILARISKNPKTKMENMISEYDLQNYSNEELNYIRPLLPSFKEEHSINKQMHPDTIRSLKYTKIPLEKLTLKNIGYNSKDGSCSIYNFGADKYTNQAIIDRLLKFDGDGSKAFKEPFHKISAKNEPGAIIKSVKVTSSYTGYKVHNGITMSAMSLRIDVYKSSKRLEIVPVYRYNIFEELPHISASGKDMNNDEYEFLFTLYPNDTLIADDGNTLLKYKAFDKSNGSASLDIIKHGEITTTRISLNKFTALQKVRTGILGDISVVKTEQRLDFKNMKR